MSSSRLLVFYDYDLDESDVLALKDTVSQITPVEFDVLPCDTLDPGNLSDTDVIVFCGKKAAEMYLGKVKITEEAGNIRAFELTMPEGEKAAYSCILQLSPAYIRKQASLKGGASEKAIRLYLDVWEQVSKMCQGVLVEEPVTHALRKESEIISFLEFLLTSKSIKEVTYDYETWGDVDALRPELCRQFKIVSINVAYEDRHKNIISTAFMFDRPSKANKRIEDLWLRVLREKELCAHFIRYEHKCNLKRFGFTVPGKDTLLMLHALDELADGGLDRVMVRCGLHWGSFKETYDEVRKNPMYAAPEQLLRYGGLDACATHSCKNILSEELAREGLTEIARQDEKFSYYLAKQEMHGLQVDMVVVAKKQAEIAKEASNLMRQIRKIPQVRRVEEWARTNIKKYQSGKEEPVFNPKSTPMMHRLVVDELKIKPITKKKNGVESVTFNADALETLAHHHPILKSINDFRSSKSMETFLSKWGSFVGPGGAVHSNYSQTIVVTGRLSSTNPPLQNIPKDHNIREVFVSRFPNGWLINGDYAQQEPRLIAGWSGDQKMIEAINTGLDLHSFVAAEIFEKPYEEISKEGKERDVGKKMNLGIAYGQTEYGLSAKTGMSIDAARALLMKYDRKFPGISSWRLEFHKDAMMYGYVEDLFGARRHLPDAQGSDKWVRERALRQAGNFPVQGTAYRFTQISVGVLTDLFEEYLPGKAYVVGQVHDSIVVDCAEDVLDQALSLMEEAMLIHNEMPWWEGKGVPMKIDLKVGKDMFNMHKVA